MRPQISIEIYIIHKKIILKLKQDCYPQNKWKIINKLRETVKGLFKSLLKYQTKNK